MNSKAIHWTELEVLRALGQPTCADMGRILRRISTDTRSLGVGDLFVALRGARFDGHDFLKHAADAGAEGAVVERISSGALRTLRYFLVQDTLQALGALARNRRMQLAARVLGVVGSNGKTTTKDLIRAALA